MFTFVDAIANFFWVFSYSSLKVIFSFPAFAFIIILKTLSSSLVLSKPKLSKKLSIPSLSILLNLEKSSFKSSSVMSEILYPKANPVAIIEPVDVPQIASKLSIKLFSNR